MASQIHTRQLINAVYHRTLRECTTELRTEAHKQLNQRMQSSLKELHMLIATNSGLSLSSHNASFSLMAVVT